MYACTACRTCNFCSSISEVFKEIRGLCVTRCWRCREHAPSGTPTIEAKHSAGKTRHVMQMHIRRKSRLAESGVLIHLPLLQHSQKEHVAAVGGPPTFEARQFDEIRSTLAHICRPREALPGPGLKRLCTGKLDSRTGPVRHACNRAERAR